MQRSRRSLEWLGLGAVGALGLATAMLFVGGASAHQDPCHSQHSCPSDDHTYVWTDLSTGLSWDCAEPGASEYDPTRDTTVIVYDGLIYYCRAAGSGTTTTAATTTSAETTTEQSTTVAQTATAVSSTEMSRTTSQTTTATQTRSVPPTQVRPPLYKNCRSLNRRYPHGVGKAGARDRTSGRPVTNFFRSTRVYLTAMRWNRGLDSDGDGIACEKR